MGAEQLQFVFSLFSFVGVVGTLFYLIIEKAKQDEQQEKVDFLEEKVLSLESYIYEFENRLKSKDETHQEESIKEKIIALYEEGKELSLIENTLNVPRAKIEMVLKFHNLQKSDNWRNSVD